MSKLVDELFDVLKECGARVVFWVCPNGCNGRVTWNADRTDATCEVCGTKRSQNKD